MGATEGGRRRRGRQARRREDGRVRSAGAPKTESGVGMCGIDEDNTSINEQKKQASEHAAARVDDKLAILPKAGKQSKAARGGASRERSERASGARRIRVHPEHGDGGGHVRSRREESSVASGADHQVRPGEGLWPRVLHAHLRAREGRRRAKWRRRGGAQCWSASDTAPEGGRAGSGRARRARARAEQWPPERAARRTISTAIPSALSAVPSSSMAHEWRVCASRSRAASASPACTEGRKRGNGRRRQGRRSRQGAAWEGDWAPERGEARLSPPRRLRGCCGAACWRRGLACLGARTAGKGRVGNRRLHCQKKAGHSQTPQILTRGAKVRDAHVELRTESERETRGQPWARGTAERLH